MKISMSDAEFKKLFTDVIITALEGGSNYWYHIPQESARIVRLYVTEETTFSEAVVEALIRKKPIQIFHYRTLESLGTLTRTSVINAFCLALTEHLHIAGSIIDGSADADHADTFFQLAVMGEITYS